MVKFYENLLPENSVPKRFHRSTFLRLFIRTLFRSYQWITTHKFSFVVFVSFIFPLVFYYLLLIASRTSLLIPSSLTDRSQRVLLVAAHPDDECLFFAPTLRVFKQHYNYPLSLIIFSRGNHQGLGQIRAEELLGSCTTLEIPKERCIALDLPDLQDNPKVWWPQDTLINQIRHYSNEWSIDLLVTFDHGGISGHINHRAVSSAVHSIARNKSSTKVSMFYELDSVSLLRKFSAWIDFDLIFFSYSFRLLRSIFAFLDPFDIVSPIDTSRLLLVNTPHDYFASRRAFASHKTQFSWDRHLYLFASRYMYVNELRSIEKNQ